jgi:pyruvate dehydrogenase E1 component alpha subunit
MILIRKFEEALIARPDHGFQLLSSGQEAVSVGVCAAMTEDDQLLSSGRAIAPALARGLDPASVMAELLGKTAGLNRGKAGRGHLAEPDKGFFGAHAVVGGNLSVAAGVALAHQVDQRRGVVVCLFGDGACGAGALHESMNIAALWKLPLVFICDNNQFSVSTPPKKALAPKRLSDLAAPFGIPAATIDGMDVLAVHEAASRFLARARSGAGPAFLECLSERFAAHSTATRETRLPERVAELRGRCPILRLASKLAEDGVLDDSARTKLEAEVEAIVKNGIAFADASPYPDPAEAISDVS